LNHLSTIIHKVIESICKYFIFSYVSLRNCIYRAYINSPSLSDNLEPCKSTPAYVKFIVSLYKEENNSRFGQFLSK